MFFSHRILLTDYIYQIECAIDEWAEGSRLMIHFSEGDYIDVYKRHYASLEEFKNMTAEAGICNKCYAKATSVGRRFAEGGTHEETLRPQGSKEEWRSRYMVDN